MPPSKRPAPTSGTAARANGAASAGALCDTLAGAFGEALKMTWAECLRRGRRGRSGSPGGGDWPVEAVFRPTVEVFDGGDAWLAFPVGIEVALHRSALGVPGSAFEVHVELRLALGHGADPRVFHEVEADIVLPAAAA